MAEAAKTWPPPPLLLPAHWPALLCVGAGGAPPNPLQPKSVNTFLSAIRVADKQGATKWLEVTES